MTSFWLIIKFFQKVAKNLYYTTVKTSQSVNVIEIDKFKR